MLASGAGESFGIDGLVRALQDFDPVQAIAEFKVKESAPTGLWDKEHLAFIEYLKKIGLVAPVSHQIWYLGDYAVDVASSRFD